MSTNSQEILLNNLSNVNDINNTSVSWIKFERFNLVHVLKKGKYKLVRNEKSPEVIKDFIISLRDNYPFTSNDDSYKKIMEKSLAFSDFELSEMFGTIAKMRDQFKAEDVWVFEITFILAERNEEHLQTIDFYIEYFSRKSLKEISKSFLYSLATMKNKSGIIRVGDYYNKSKSKYIQKESLEILKAEAITRGVV